MDLKKILFLVHNNQYDSKRVFTKGLCAALERRSISCLTLDTPHGELTPHQFQQVIDENPDLLASFSQIVPAPDGRFICDALRMPHLSLLLDPAYSSLKLTGSPYSLISCVDRLDCLWLDQAGFRKHFFFPHGVERSLCETPLQEERPIDVVFLGSCYDHEAIRESWREKYPKELLPLMDEAAERILADQSSSIVQSVFATWREHGRGAEEEDLVQLCFDVDYYCRGKERLDLITAFPHLQVHLFGQIQWATTSGARHWSSRLGKQKNIHIHPPVSYEESLKVLQKSKIALNSVPFFKQGSHERIFGGMACGAVVVTNGNLYAQETFRDREELLLFDSHSLSQLEGVVAPLIEDEGSRREIAAQAQKLVKEEHTWDQRAAVLEKELKLLLPLI